MTIMSHTNSVMVTKEITIKAQIVLITQNHEWKSLLGPIHHCQTKPTQPTKQNLKTTPNPVSKGFGRN